jgi:hypothetical protein
MHLHLASFGKAGTVIKETHRFLIQAIHVGGLSLKLRLSLLTAAMIAAPAIAQEPPSDTVKAVIEKGVSMEAQGNVGTIEYKPDGTFSGFDGMFSGTYKADGNKLCITVEAFGMVDACQAYPDGKKSGDTFDLTSDMGTMQVTIR